MLFRSSEGKVARCVGCKRWQLHYSDESEEELDVVALFIRQHKQTCLGSWMLQSLTAVGG